MNRKYYILFLLLVIGAILIWFFWPKKTSSRLIVDVKNAPQKLTIKHFDDAFFGADTANFKQTIEQLKVAYQPFFLSNDAPNFWLIQRMSESQQNLYQDRKKVLPDYSNLNKDLSQAFAHYYHYYPQNDSIQLFTYISNLDFDYPVILADGLIFLAVDLYLGGEHPAYEQMADYLSQNRDSKYITTDVFESMAFQLARKDMNDNALINEMIWWGKVIYFIEAMQPTAADGITMRYSDNHIDFCEQNETEIWSYFVNNQLLFNTDDEVKRKFIYPAPYSKFGMPFDNETPGMIARWLGWQIIRSYMLANPNVSLPELMAETNSREIFKNSKYKP